MNPKVVTFSLMLCVSASFCASAQNSVDAKANMITVEVRGSVKKPGNYQLKENATITDAMRASGGSSFDDSGREPYAGIRHVVIQRGQQRLDVRVKDILKDPANDLVLHGGDVAQVFYKSF